VVLKYFQFSDHRKLNVTIFTIVKAHQQNGCFFFNFCIAFLKEKGGKKAIKIYFA